jgi:acyl-CoA synthetase (NDP forming)
MADGRRAKGHRLAIVTTSGGSGVAMTDAAADAGLSVPRLPEEDQIKLLGEMPEPFFGNLANPVDTTSQVAARPGAVERVVEILEDSQSTDMIAAVYWSENTSQFKRLIEIHQSNDKPLAVLCNDRVPFVLDAGLPIYLDPARTVNALGIVARQSLDRPTQCAPGPLNHDRAARARQILGVVRGGEILMEHEAKRLLAEYGIPVTREKLVQDVAEAGAVAAELGGKVAIKAMSPQLPHKSDVGGIRLNLTAELVTAAAREMLEEVTQRAPDASLEGILVQEMVPAGIEMVCGIKRDPVFGAVVVVGLGGIAIEILAEIAMLRPPFDAQAARRAISRLCNGRLVSARRALDDEEIAALAAIMVGLGQIALELPEIAEVDINPVRLADGRAIAADALILVDAPAD